MVIDADVARFFAFAGTQVANTPQTAGAAPPTGPNPQQLMYIALSFGFSLAVNAWVFYRVSGGLFNPAVGIVFNPSWLTWLNTD